MNRAYKQHLLGIIFEEVEKQYYNAKHSKRHQQAQEYQQYLEELNNKEIKSEKLKFILTNMGNNHHVPNMPIFVGNILKGQYVQDGDLKGPIRDFQTPSFF